MITCRPRALLWTLVVLLTACSGSNDKRDAAAHAAAERKLLDYYITQKTGADPTRVDAGLRARLEGALIQLKAAARKGESLPGVQLRLELARLELLARAGADAAGVTRAPTDAELQTAYRRYVEALPAMEFHAAHILVATQTDAVAIIGRLHTGEDFAAVAATDSADDSKSKGGDLGWVYSGRLPAAFVDSLKTLKPGNYTDKPVHTAYGWHVIRLIETRLASPPRFEIVRAQLATNLQQARYQQFLGEAVTKP